MFLSDESIDGLIDSGVLSGAVHANVNPISYDLRTQAFYTNAGESKQVSLNPGDSVYVAAQEVINLGKDLSAVVSLRNSRIRQGLSLDAPVYFPGHHTRVFFRITNVSGSAVDLDTNKGIAQILFERVDGKVAHPYEGAFSDELDYRGLGDYSDVYSGEVRLLEDKRDELRGMESRIYERTIALMAIFAAVFTLVNVNAGAAVTGAALLDVNLSIVGGFSALVGLIGIVLKAEPVWARVAPFVIAVLAFAATLFL